MSVAERRLTPSQAPDEIVFAREKVREGNHAAALQAILQAKAMNPRNIFLIALEKQIARLKNGGILPRERAEIIESLESLFERAQTEGPSKSAAAAPPTIQMQAAGERKDLRLKLVVDQYFKHADEWIQRGDFEAAAKEIERVLLVDPQNRVAKEYQTRVHQLLTTEPSREPVEEDLSLPPLPVLHPPAAAAPAPTPGPLKGFRLWQMAGVGILLLCVIGAGIYFLRPYKPQYKPGMMYVVQQAVPEGEQTVVPTTAENVPVIPNESTTKPESRIVPPASAPVKESEKSAGKPGPTGTEKPVEKPVTNASRTEEVKKIVADPLPVSPSVVNETKEPGPPPSVPAAEASGEASKPFVPVEQPPKILNLVQPEFSDEQVRKGVAGDIVVKVQIDKSGKPLQAKVTSSTNPDLNDAVIAAVMRSTYAPGVMSIGPVTTWMSIPLKLK